MRIVWWGLVAIGLILVAAGGYAVVASQDALNYIKSCEHVVATCTTAGNPRPTMFLSSSLTSSLQEAQGVWLLSIALLGIGIAIVVYGIYLHPSVRGQAASSGKPIGAVQIWR